MNADGPRPPGGGRAGTPPGAGLYSGTLPLTGWRQTFSSLAGNRDFQFLFAGNVGFFFGMNMMIILRGWLVFDEWDNASYLGYIMATVAIPMLFLSPIGGVVTDRIDKRKLLLITQSTLVVSNSLVAALILTDAIEFWHLLAVSILSGSAFAFNMPGRQALVAILVPRQKLMNAISLSTAAMNASRIIAPPIAGVLVAPIGIGGAYIISTAFYAFAVVATVALPALPASRSREFTFVEDLVGGFSYIRGSSLLIGLLLFATVPMVFALPYQTLMPVFADEVWDVGSAGFGVLQAGSGVGGLVGALVLANLDAFPRKGRLLLSGTMAFGACLILFALSPSFYLALAVITAIGFASMVVMTVTNTAIQFVIPDEVRGRVMSVMMMSFGLMPLGAVPAGIGAEAFGAPPVVVVAAVLFLVSSLLVFALIPSFRSIDRSLEAARPPVGRPGVAVLDEEPAAGAAVAVAGPAAVQRASAKAE